MALNDQATTGPTDKEIADLIGCYDCGGTDEISVQCARESIEQWERNAVLRVRAQTVEYIDHMLIAIERRRELHKHKDERWALMADAARTEAFKGIRTWLTGEYEPQY